MRLAPTLAAAALAGAAALALPVASAETPARWCAPELETLPAEVCHYSPPAEREPRTLVIYLHGVVKPDTTWQHTQQRAIVRAAKTHRFATIAPRGRRGNGPKNMRDWWTWPTSHRAQQSIEQSVLDEWAAAKKLLEDRNGEPFERTYVFGFSNGAYYATSLALRGRLDSVDGYAVFAGGAAPKHLKKRGVRTKHRPPIYVGYGLKDKAHRDPQRLGRALRAIGWRVRIGERRRAGHTMADSMVLGAMRFFERTVEKGAPKK